MKVLVGCEFSGIVRDAFRAKGHDAWSCDIDDDETGSKYHIKGDVLGILDQGWDLAIFHPPCRYLCVSGAAYFKYRQKEQAEALDFVRKLLDCKIPRIALENPVSVISSQIRKPTQVIHPWQFGHGEKKTTCLWLKNLPKLTPTDIVEGREEKNRFMWPSPTRSKDRSRTYLGIAAAMADQWGEVKEIQAEMEAWL